MTDSGTTMELSVSIITLIASLVVALAAVYFDHWLSKRVERKKILMGLYAEVWENIAILKRIIEIADTNMEVMKDNKAVVNPFPVLKTDMWIQAKSSKVLFELMIKKDTLSNDLYNAYLLIYRINELTDKYEILKLTSGLDEEIHAKFHVDFLRTIDLWVKQLSPILEKLDGRFERMLDIKQATA
jgi:hypothetical protein